MDSGTADWWRRHGWTIGLLLLAFGIALALRTIWTYPIVEKWGALYTYAGGSDSYYHSRVMTYIIQTHSNLKHDPMLKFPIGATNPREPLFDWMNAILGILFAPLFGGNANSAGAWFLDLQAPLWAALEVFPLYLIGREVGGRRTGLIAALVYPFFSASINTSTFGYADYQSFYTFMLLVVVYAYLRTVKAVGHRRWVESYREPRQILAGLRGVWRSEQTAVKWAVFTGVALGAFALSWQGYTYAIVVVIFTLIVAMVIERIRRVDSFSLYVVTWIIAVVGLGMSAPYYIVQHQLKAFLELPAILLFGSLAILLPFLLLRDVPWVFSIPTLLAVVVGGVLALRFLSPTLFTAAITGNGYFVKNLIYSTVAEAQAPSFDALVVGYGVVTFFLAFVGLALYGYYLAHHRFKRYHIAFLVFAVVSVYLPMSATKFFLVGAPAFALLSAEAFHRMLDVGGYGKLRRAVASLSDRTGSLGAFRRSFKARHVLVMVLVVGILLPNVWVAIDAGIPSNAKGAFETQINKTIPSWLKLNSSAPASNYLGAAGSGLDTPNQYDSAGYNWLAHQDTSVPEPQRPAFVDWWDYGFQAIDQGEHPSVADNFQNGIDPAGQFLLSQNESLAIGILATTLLQGEIQLTHDPTLPASLNHILADDNVNVTRLHQILDDERADYQLVVAHPRTYLPVNPATLTEDNAMYLVTSYYLATHLPLAGVARVYDDLEGYTGWSIRYAATDTRLFPFSGTNTGIFYAPADLTGRVISAEGVPTTFYNVTILGSDGNTYPLGPLPEGVSAVRYNINYSAPFYNTMLYRIYIGYNGTDVGQSPGIPGLSGSAQSDAIKPGWMLQHFEVEYQTAYVCPGVANAPPSSPCYHAVNRPAAIRIANATNGSSNVSAFDYFQGGESILTYYPGVTLDGRVALPSGKPVAGVWVTVYDGWGIPHMVNVTNAQGEFSVVLPPGNDTVNITTGKFAKLNESGTDLIASIPEKVSDALGYSPSSPTMVQTYTVGNSSANGLVFWNVSGNGTYVAEADPVVHGAVVTLTGANGATVLNATTDPSGTFSLPGLAPGQYNVSVRVGNVTYPQKTAYLAAGGSKNLSLALSPGVVTGTVKRPSQAAYIGVPVSLLNATGIYATTTTNTSGEFRFPSVPPGHYEVEAIGNVPTSSSPRVSLTLAQPGESASVNLTVQPRGAVDVGVEAAGTSVANATVTFVPMVDFGHRPTSPLQAVLTVTGNTTLARSTVDGVASAGLGLGEYTVEATGRVGGVLYSGLTTVNVSVPGSVTDVSVVLTPTAPLTVTLTHTSPAAAANRTAVLAYTADGAQVVAWTAANSSSATLELPAGDYSLLGLSGSTNADATALSAFATVNDTAATAMTLPLGPSATVTLQVGTPASSGSVLAAPNASVELSVPGGASFRATSDVNGTVGFVVPSSAGATSGGFCLGASAFGFVANGSCGWSASELSNLGTFPLSVRPVSVSLRVVGLPSKTPITVNITGESTGTSTVSLHGHPTFALELTPGVYGVGARAVIGNGTTVYLPSSVLSTRIPLGATYSNLTLVVVPEINASGKLVVPAHVGLSNVTVSLTSPELNLTLTGKQYTSQFRATPANYTATVTTNISGVEFVNVSHISISDAGAIHPKLVLAQAGIPFTGTLDEKSGTTLQVNTSVTLLTGSGLVIHENAVAGTFHGTLPEGTYRVFANATGGTNGPNGTYATSWSTATGATCTLAANLTRCAVPTTSTTLPVTIHGTLAAAGGTTPLGGTVRLAGPYPSHAVEVLSASNGTFTAVLAPGAYNVYAVSTSSPRLAVLTKLLALPAEPSTVTFALKPTWQASLNLSLGAGNTTAGPATLTVRNAFGTYTAFPNVVPGSSVVVALPLGNYTVKASGNGTRNGVAGTAVASGKLSVANGNVIRGLSIAVPVAATVAGVVSGPTSASVAPRGSATFSFTVRNTGNVPVTITPAGAPSTWTFNFSFSHVTLAPGASLTGEVRIFVPAGTGVAHPAVSLGFDLPNGTQIGVVAPTPVVNVLATYGLLASTSASALPKVGSAQAILPFYLTNRGNTNETVVLTAVDAARLASYGWTVGWMQNNKTLSGDTVDLSAGENASLALNLTTSLAAAIAPGSVTVLASVQGRPTATAEVVLVVPHPSVGTLAGSLSVTGTRVQSGPPAVPSWILPVAAFGPTIALLAAIVVYRWWRTRRWTRR
ncbi:MAG TPA: carboxypeptidase regulatory-like domain-containing protein [Thermoplasmata archaeon]|nr:carboxypeptidase regulatory-like domain-containing protein [Thermoplasmata archaeon]